MKTQSLFSGLLLLTLAGVVHGQVPVSGTTTSQAPVDAVPTNGIVLPVKSTGAAKLTTPAPKSAFVRSVRRKIVPQTRDKFSSEKVTVKIIPCDDNGTPVEDIHPFLLGDEGYLYVIIRNTNDENVPASFRIVTTTLDVDPDSLDTVVSQDALRTLWLKMPMKMIVGNKGVDRTLTAGTLKFRLPLGIHPNLENPKLIPKGVLFNELLDSQFMTHGATVFINFPDVPPHTSVAYKFPWKVIGPKAVTLPTTQWTLSPSTSGADIKPLH